MTKMIQTETIYRTLASIAEQLPDLQPTKPSLRRVYAWSRIHNHYLYLCIRPHAEPLDLWRLSVNAIALPTPSCRQLAKWTGKPLRAVPRAVRAPYTLEIVAMLDELPILAENAVAVVRQGEAVSLTGPQPLPRVPMAERPHWTARAARWWAYWHPTGGGQ